MPRHSRGDARAARLRHLVTLTARARLGLGLAWLAGVVVIALYFAEAEDFVRPAHQARATFFRVSGRCPFGTRA